MTEVADNVIISRRYCGPPDSANGGYACGLLAQRMAGSSRVRLMRPPPLEQPLLIRGDANHLKLLGGEQTVAEARPSEPADYLPASVGYDVAENAARNFRWRTDHPFPTCFVCGPERHGGDGLGIFPGRVSARDVVAAAWTPDATVSDSKRTVHLEVVWAVLDCPSWFGVLEFEPNTSQALLGQLTARVLRRPATGERCVVLGWSRGREGRKLYGAAALYTDAGELLGNSEAVWIEPK
jgi:hypothetical protein